MRLILAAALSLTPMIATAHGDTPEEMAVAARHGYMLMLDTNMAPLYAMAKGDIPYDEATATFHANNLAALANYEVEMHFLPGTARGEMEDSRALPKAWENLEDVRKKHENLKTAALAAPGGVTGGPENVAKVVQNIGTACKACHDEYRAK